MSGLPEMPGDSRELIAGSRRWLFAAAAAYLVFVVYGSLVPLEFEPLPLTGAWERFSAIPRLDIGIGSRADWVANVLLFAPLAYLWTGALWPGGRTGAALAVSLLVWLACVALGLGVEFAQIYFPPRTVSQNDIFAETVGAALGILAWWWSGPWITRELWAWQARRGPTPLPERLLWIYLAVLFGYSLLPLDLTISPVEIYHKWREGRVILVPFGDAFESTPDTLYGLAMGALIWLPVGFLWTVAGRRTPLRAAFRTLLAAALLEFLQLFVLSRISETADVITAVAGGALGALLALPFRPGAAAADGSTPGEGKRASAGAGGAAGIVKRLLFFALGVAAIAGALNLAMSYPGAPYDLRALFIDAGGAVSITTFAIWLLWIGMSGALLGRLGARIGFAFIVIPALIIVAAALGYILLAASVTPDSIESVLGAPLFRRVSAGSAILEWIRRAILDAAPALEMVDQAETVGRYAALLGPLILCLAIFNASIERLAIYGRNERVRYFLSYCLVYFVLLSPWFYLSKLAVLDFAATDYLTGLVAPARFGVVGGEVFLFVLIVVIALHATLLARAGGVGPKWFLLAVAAFLGAVPLGWLLVNAGLVSELATSGRTIPGLEFLLGPGRETPLSTVRLFLGWSMVYVAGVSLLAYGAGLVLPFGRGGDRQPARLAAASESG
ncbi:MAG: VanZ family protein [Alphaproteobacteria bacterium]